MKHLVTYIKEGLFDKDLVKQDPLDFSWFKRLDKDELFYFVDSYLNCKSVDELPHNMVEVYYDHEIEFKYIVQQLSKSFDKQKYNSWFTAELSDFDDTDSEMTEEEIDKANKELADFFKKAHRTERGGYFIIGKGNIPDFLVHMMKGLDGWNNKMTKLDIWAIEYYTDFYSAISFYGCPKDLDKTVKKLLYE